MKHFTSLKNYEADDLERIIDRALDIKVDPGRYSSSLSNKQLYMLFQKTSTRTAVSFAVGMNELGGQHYTQKWNDSNFAVAEICDEVRYLGPNVDVIMARLKQNGDVVEMAKHSTVPVINGCCDRYHPCQAMADVLTIRELFGSCRIRFPYIGIKNNVYNSLLLSLPRLGCEFHAITPIVNRQSEDEDITIVEKTEPNIHNIHTDDLTGKGLRELVNGMDVVYTDSWIDMEFFNDEEYGPEKDRRIETMLPYQVNADLMEGSKAKVLHDMPIHTGFEIDRETAEDNMDAILQQAENRRHVQKAIMLELLG